MGLGWAGFVPGGAINLSSYKILIIYNLSTPMGDMDDKSTEMISDKRIIFSMYMNGIVQP